MDKFPLALVQIHPFKMKQFFTGAKKLLLLLLPSLDYNYKKKWSSLLLILLVKCTYSHIYRSMDISCMKEHTNTKKNNSEHKTSFTKRFKKILVTRIIFFL